MKRNTRKNSKFNLILIIRPKLSFKLGEFCLEAHQSHVGEYIGLFYYDTISGTSKL